MWKYGVLILCLSVYCLAGPVGVKKRNISIGQQKANDDAAPFQAPHPDGIALMSTLTLPSNATSIRADITDNFSCENKAYGYYADVDNDCQIFHVCLPVTYADGKENIFRWSFICPEETIFSQESFTCMRPDDMVSSCEESFKYYDLNNNFGQVELESEKEPQMLAESEPEEESNATPITLQKPNRRKPSATQKKPSISYPLRKVSQTEASSNTASQITNIKGSLNPIEEEEIREELIKEEEIKPVIHKFSRHPVATPIANILKDKMPNVKPETVNIMHSNLYDQKRKRPTVHHKEPVEETIVSVQDEPAKEITPIEAETPQQAFPEVVGVPSKDEYANSEQSFFALEPQLSNSNIEVQTVDSENQASEHNKILVKPEEPETDKINEVPFNPKEPQILEAFEEIPAVITEVEEPAGQSFDEALKQENDIPREQIKPEEEQEAAGDKIQIPQEAIALQESEASEETISPSVEIHEAVEESEIPKENQEHQEHHNPEPIEENPQRVEETQLAENAEITAESEAVEGSQEPETVATDTETEIAQDSAIPADNLAIKESEPARVENQASSAEETQLTEETAMTVDSEAGFQEPLMEEETLSAQQSHLTQEPEDNQEMETPEGSESQVDESSLEHEMIPVEEKDEISAASPEEPSLIKIDLEQDASAEIPLAEESQQNISEIKSKPEETPATFAEPAIFEENSEETGAAQPEQTVEEMEEEKPADAPESMPATEEMSQQDPMVQEMFEENVDDTMKQTIGGFKPVDPEMAAEAEQLIVDFINTLRKNEFVNDKPGMPMHVSMMEENIADSSEGAVGTVEEAAEEAVQEVQENQGQSEEVNREQTEELSSEPQKFVEAAQSEESEPVKHLQEESKPEEQPIAEEVTKIEEESNVLESDENKEEQENQSPNNLMSQESYQIPVEVITAPQEETSQQGTAGIKPLSIDDIVELVKERLDQMPKDKMETPMQLDQVLSEAKPNDNGLPQAIVEQASEEDIITPIYHRTADVPHENVPVANVDASVSDAVDAVPTKPLEKISRFYRLHSKLSPKKKNIVRKRRFLFRSDES